MGRSPHWPGALFEYACPAPVLTPGADKEKRLTKALNKIQDAYDALVTDSENLSPFYPADEPSGSVPSVLSVEIVSI